jgi:hypothetical protein
VPIKVVCDICGEPHKVGDNRVGAKMRCRACDTGIRVPKGPYVDEDEELLDPEEHEEEAPPEGLTTTDVLRRVRDGAGAVFGLVLMGFYVAFTFQFLTGEEAPPTTGWRSSRTASTSSRFSRPQARANVPNFPRPAMPEFRPPQFPRLPDAGIPDPAFPNPGLPEAPAIPPFDPHPFPGRPNTFPGAIPGRTNPGSGLPHSAIPGRSPAAAEAEPLRTDSDQPVVVNSLSPATGGPGTVVTLRGKGFEGTTRVVFASFHSARLNDGSDAGEFRVVSDTELTVVAPRVVTLQPTGSIIEVHTPQGVAVTWPADSVVSADGDRGAANANVVVRGSPSGPFTSCNVLVESGASVDSAAFSKVYVRAGGHVERFVAFNAIVASTAAKPLQTDGRNQPLYVPEVYPSYVPRLFNRRP